MKTELKFLGATDSVTGSLSLLKLANKSYLIDCGQFQGPKPIRDRNRSPFPFNPSSIDGVFLTHAHLDHIGRLPQLVKQGFDGPIYCSQGTAEIGKIILLDSAHLEEEFADYANETGYSNHKPALPLFRTEDAEKAISQFKVIPRSEWVPVCDSLQVRLLKAGHIIGSSIIQLKVGNEYRNPVITFSGDLGRKESLTMKEKEIVSQSDYVVIESTYGS